MARMHTVLVTGFERFGEHSSNPTEEAVRELPGVIAGAEVVTAVLPVEFGRCAQVALGLVAVWTGYRVGVTVG